MAEAEDPRVAPRGPHSVPHLVGEGLETERMVGGGERAGQGLVGALRVLRAEKPADRLLETPLQHAGETIIGHAAGAREIRLRRQMVAMNRREKKQSPDAAIQIGLLAAVKFQFGAGAQQLGGRPARAPAGDGEVPGLRHFGLNDVGDAQAHGNLQD